MVKKKKDIVRTKRECPCCRASGFSFSKSIWVDEVKHDYDRGWIPEQSGGSNYGKWVASCNHKTGKKVKHYQTWAEYECKCTFPND